MRIPSFIAVVLVLAAAGCTRDATPAAVTAAEPPTAAATTAAVTDAPVMQADTATPAIAEAAVVDDHASVNTAIDRVLGDHVKYERVITAFQSAVAGKDPVAVAALVDYPFNANIDGKPMKIVDADAFVARYDAILTPAIAEVIAGQKYADLFVNYKGVMFGSGEAWINGICKDTACKDVDVRVVTIQPVQ